MAAPAHGGEAAASGTLPQFDPTFFASQIFWLAITFGLLYFLLSQALLPKLEATLEARAAKIRSDLDAAAKANADAQAAMTGFERSLAEARAQARSLADTVRTEAESVRAAQVAEAETRMEQQLAAAEARIAASREAALASARNAGAESAGAIVARLLGRHAPAGAS